MTFRKMNWCFTWNNPDYDQEQPNVWPCVKYAIWQHEVGENGTPHFQGYVVFDKLMSLKQLKEINDQIHWEPRRGSHAEAKAYCSKEDTRTDGPFEYGEEPLKQGQRTDLEDVAEYTKDHTMAEVAEAFPSQFVRYERGLAAYKNIITPDRTTHTQLIIYWGPPLTGKSTRCRELWPDAYWLKRARTGEPWWDGYDGQATVIIDEFYGWIGVDTMSRLIDFTPMQVEHKGKTVKFTSERIVIISNKDPETWWQCELYGMRRRLDQASIMHVTEPIWQTTTDMQEHEEPQQPMTIVSGLSMVFTGLNNKNSAITRMAKEALNRLKHI